MNLKFVFDLFVGMIAVAIALSVASTNFVAAVCLIIYASLIVFRYESERFSVSAEEYDREISIAKILLLLVAFGDLFL